VKLPRIAKTPLKLSLSDWKTCAGYLAMIAALALSLPGVRVVRADDDEVAVISLDLVDSGRTCDPNPEPPRSTAIALPDQPDRTEESPSIALNTQGYSYQPPSVDPEARRLEHH